LIKQTKLSDEEKRKAVLHLQIKQNEGWTADEVQLLIKCEFFEGFAKRFEGLNYDQIDRETNDKNCSSFPSLILIHFLTFVFHLVPFQILLDLFISCLIFIRQSLHFFDFVNPSRFSFECC
jgi:hypothetical protein